MTDFAPRPASRRTSALGIAAALCLLLTFGNPLVARAQSGIEIDSTAVVYSFGGQMVFTLTAHAEADITSAALLVRSGNTGRTDVLEAPLTPSQQISVELRRDLQTQPFAPFSPVSYAWRLSDSAGRTLTSPEQTIIYEDNRFTWQSATRGVVTAHWYNGDIEFGQAVADIGYESLTAISQSLRAPLPPAIDVYVYHSFDDLQAGLRLGGRSWVGGHADPTLGVILVSAAPGVDGLINLEQDVPHEMSHVLVYQLTAPGYQNVPTWLDEGLAVLNELQPSADYPMALSAASKDRALIPISSLCGSFGIDPSRAFLSYAQSQSLVRYIMDRWGPGTINQLLAAYRDGATCEGGVQRVLNLTLAELQNDWQRDALEISPLWAQLRNAFPALVVFLIPAVVIALLVFAPGVAKTANGKIARRS